LFRLQHYRAIFKASRLQVETASLFYAMPSGRPAGNAPPFMANFHAFYGREENGRRFYDRKRKIPLRLRHSGSKNHQIYIRV
jgi:hypothetical protein